MPADHQKEKAYTISELAREFDISNRTIRFYEEKNLISPRRTKGNYRLYSRRDRQRLRLILRGKRFGYTLDEISEIIGLDDIDRDEAEQIRRAIAYGKKKILEIRERINELKLLEKDMMEMGEKLLTHLNSIEGEKAGGSTEARKSGKP
ncbi:MAG: MerR family DNA-binding transcriptional regulator [Thermodesulfobacteriota bacterium]|nr:MerR family DNA-binding transcriptional regulator [Thermodesulfobacteriota bacterium]